MSRSDTDLSFLYKLTPIARETALWADGTMPLDVCAYISDRVPPASLVSSVRCILRRGADIMVIEDFKGDHHILPGGRCEPGEESEETLQRELLEETGWTAHSPVLVGFTYFHHLQPAPEGYKYPHPDFFQLIYVSEAGEHRPDAMEEESEWEKAADFRPATNVRSLNLDPINRAFLEANL
jgi:8-oxo-dGTP pyrophosphatase MutT (NUDIX family)